MRNASKTVFVLLATVVTCVACGPKQPEQPALAPDRTLQGDRQENKVGTCQWVPSLPSDREDVCNRDNAGATLKLVVREDMREQSASKGTFTCTCQ